MSKYVTKKHGITIGSDNIFFYRDEKDYFHDFKCIVSISRLYFDGYSTLHVGIRSTAEQLLFYPEKIKISRFGYSLDATCYRLKNYWVQWLNENCPGWGYPPMRENEPVPNIFFMKRKHALAFYNHIDELLKGQRYL